MNTGPGTVGAPADAPFSADRSAGARDERRIVTVTQRSGSEVWS